MNIRITCRHRAVVSSALRFVGGVVFLSLFLTTAACSTAKTATDAPRVTFDRRSIAMMTVPTTDDAERLRQSLLRGELLPPSARIVPVGELDRINPSLSKIAAQLAECEISPPIATSTSAGYVVLQRGSDPDNPCEGTPQPLSDRLKKAGDTAGEILMGLLVVGLVGFGIAAPFLFGFHF
jgi:hypothetical protein